MATILGEEYLCYSESSTTGHFTPLIAIVKYDGSVSFRDVVKEDLARMSDDSVFPGTWLFRQTISSTGSWVKRFATLRREFIFLFHSPVNDKPIAIIPLAGAKIVLPDGGEKTFDERRHIRANDGFEFDIRHTSRPTVRLYALSEEERREWTLACQSRCQAVSAFDFTDNITPALPPGGNIVVTGTKLSGLLLSGAEPGEELLPTHQPPTPRSFQQPSRPADRDADLALQPMTMQALSPAHSTFLDPHSSAISVQGLANSHGAAVLSVPAILAEHSAHHKILTKRTLQLDKYADLEENLIRIVEQQRDARQRQDATLARLHSKEWVNEMRNKESTNPLTLAELLRLGLFFFDEELAEDPQADSMQQFPHVKGQASEAMILAVYQRYCGESGFMALEQFIEFMEDSAIMQTHAPHDDNDEPLEEYKNALDPVRLLYSVPRSAEGIEASSSYYLAHERQLRAQSKDRFIIGFSQFYQILLHIAQIVFPSLYESDPTVAFNKILLEVMLPTYLWSRGKFKRGASDVLVLEERILLVLVTYLPNLWQVFLTYAADAVGKPADPALAFPEAAQLNEKGMYKLPPLAPDRFYTEKYEAMDSLIVTEGGCLKFARDFGLTPYLLSSAQLREKFREANRGKIVVSSRLPTREQVMRNSTAVDRRKKEYVDLVPIMCICVYMRVVMQHSLLLVADANLAPCMFAGLSRCTLDAGETRGSARVYHHPLHLLRFATRLGARPPKAANLRRLLHREVHWEHPPRA